MSTLEDAHEQIDRAISTALKESKPVYISISCNLAGVPHSTFSVDPIPFALSPRFAPPNTLIISNLCSRQPITQSVLDYSEF